MKFYAAANQTRPVRLSQETREFAWESQMGKYGDEAMKTPCVSLNHIDGFDNFPPLKQSDIAIREIAGKSPIRICNSERISGAATLGDAIFHMVPASRNGKLLWPSVSHLTLGFDKVLKIGINGIEKEIKEHLKKKSFSGRQPEFYESLQNTISSMRLWHKRYLNALKESNSQNYTVLKRVPFQPANSFYEAVQSLWSTAAHQML